MISMEISEIPISYAVKVVFLCWTCLFINTSSLYVHKCKLIAVVFFIFKI